MENRTLAILVIVAAVAVSGCAEPWSSDKSDQETPGDLRVTEFSITDSTLTPQQEAVITAELKNYHQSPVEIQDLSIYNLGFLEIVNDKECNPSEIRPMQADRPGTMNCEWRVKADEELESFNSKSLTLKMNLEYLSNFSNRKDPFRLDFKDMSEIESKEKIEKSYSNGEITVSMSSETPAPNQGERISFKVSNAKGGAEGDVMSPYNFTMKPEDVFKLEECGPSSKVVEKGGGESLSVEHVVGDEVEFSCLVKPETSVENVARYPVFSTSYKYSKAPSLDVRVVNK